MENVVETLTQYLVQEALILVAVLWVIGALLKRSELPDKYIIWSLLGVGIGLAVGLLGFSVESVIQGILVTGLAVFGHQLVKQTKKEG